MVRDAITVDLVARLFSRAWLASRIVVAIVLVAFVADMSNAAAAAAVKGLLIVITLGLSALAKPAPLLPLASSAALLAAVSLGLFVGRYNVWLRRLAALALLGCLLGAAAYQDALPVKSLASVTEGQVHVAGINWRTFVAQSTYAQYSPVAPFVIDVLLLVGWAFVFFPLLKRRPIDSNEPISRLLSRDVLIDVAERAWDICISIAARARDILIGVAVVLVPLILSVILTNYLQASSVVSKEDFSWPASIAKWLFFVAMWLGGGLALALILRYARRRFAFGATRKLAWDKRAPVLLLRSFADDNALIKPKGLLPTLLRRRYRLEEVVGSFVPRLGPFLAIGQPGETLPPPLGAARAYLSDGGWQQDVLRWMDEARLVIMIVGLTPSVTWELAQLKHKNYLSKSVLVLPPSSPEELSVRLSVLRDVLGDVDVAWDSNAAAPARTICFGEYDTPTIVRCSGTRQLDYELCLLTALSAIAARHSKPRAGATEADRLLTRRRLLMTVCSCVLISGAIAGGIYGETNPGTPIWRLLHDRSLRTFTGHSSSVASVAFAPDGRTALSGSYDRTLKLWDVASGKELRTFTGHKYFVYSVAFAPDGRTALSGSYDSTLKLWDVATGKELRTFTGHAKSVTSVAFAPDGRTALSGSIDKTLKLWDLATGKELRTFTGHADSVASVAFAPDGRTVLSDGSDNTLKLWDVTSGQELRAFYGHTTIVWSVTFAPDGRTALSGSWDGILKLWDVASGKELRTYPGHKNYSVNSVAFTPDGRTALSGSSDKTVKLWDVASGKELRTLIGHMGEVYSVAVAPDGRTALSGSTDVKLKLWDVTR
jgi:hypothetical protein